MFHVGNTPPKTGTFNLIPCIFHAEHSGEKTIVPSLFGEDKNSKCSTWNMKPCVLRQSEEIFLAIAECSTWNNLAVMRVITEDGN